MSGKTLGWAGDGKLPGGPKASRDEKDAQKPSDPRAYGQG